MDSSTIEKIYRLNSNFYTNVGESFSKTRQQAWPGWSRVGEWFFDYCLDNRLHEPEILDVGCGNGRFYKFIKDYADQSDRYSKVKVHYTGVDNNQTLLSDAQKMAPENNNVRFINEDLFSPVGVSQYLDRKYDLITLFGFMHHIPGAQNRAKLFKYFTEPLKKPGLLAVTFWNYKNDERFKKNVRSVRLPDLRIDETELEDGDFFLGWQNNKNVFRYAHQFDYNEINTITKISGLKIFSNTEFYEDGRTHDLNFYQLLGYDE